jgi:hypothetical protein
VLQPSARPKCTVPSLWKLGYVSHQFDERPANYCTDVSCPHEIDQLSPFAPNQEECACFGRCRSRAKKAGGIPIGNESESEPHAVQLYADTSQVTLHSELTIRFAGGFLQTGEAGSLTRRVVEYNGLILLAFTSTVCDR